MRFLFFCLFLILLISVSSVITVKHLTSAAVTKPGCLSPCTPTFYRSPEEKEDVRRMYEDAGFVVMGVGELPDGGTVYCACPLPYRVRKDATFFPH